MEETATAVGTVPSAFEEEADGRSGVVLCGIDDVGVVDVVAEDTGRFPFGWDDGKFVDVAASCGFETAL